MSVWVCVCVCVCVCVGEGGGVGGGWGGGVGVGGKSVGCGGSRLGDVRMSRLVARPVVSDQILHLHNINHQ